MTNPSIRPPLGAVIPRGIIVAGLLVLMLGACAVRRVDDSIADAGAQPVGRVADAGGPLSYGESKAILARLNVEAEGSDILRRHLAIEEAVADAPLTSDNKVDILRDGPETFAAIAAAIASAQRTLELEYYTIEDVALPGPSGGEVLLSDLLLDRCRAGVMVSIIYDSYGSSDTPAAFFDILAAAGARLLPYHPLTPTNPANLLTLNDRDHRKILVADGGVAVVGGVNLSRTYESKSPGSDDAREDEEERQEDEAEKLKEAEADGSRDAATIPSDVIGAVGDAIGLAPVLPETWRDTAIRIEGPAAVELQALFWTHWREEAGDSPPPGQVTPVAAATGHEIVRIIGSSPKDEISRFYVTLISSLRNAEERAWISAAYFVPTPEQKETLIDAARRGVDVRLLLAGSSDSPDAVAAARTHYGDLLEAGIRIYETHEVVMHAKTVVVDGVWSAVGSSNFDYRSVLFNDEVDAIVLGADTARELEAVFNEGIADAIEIDLATWEAERDLGDRIKGTFSRLWENLL